MSTIVSNEKLQEVFSLALEDRSEGYQDLVSNANAILSIMKERGQFSSFEGPTIRERLLYAESGTYTRYNGYGLLNPKPAELISDAEFGAKMAAVTVTLSGEELLQNSGAAQIEDVMTTHLMAAENELQDRFVEDLHSDGTADGGKQVTGLAAAIPTVNTSGTYGGIDRALYPIWQTSTYDISDGDVPGVAVIDSTTIKQIFDNIMIERSRGRKGPDLICCSKEHYTAYTSATVAISRITDENKLGKLGFTSLKYYGAGKSVDVVLEGGIGSAMPTGTTYFIDTSALKFRFDPRRNFKKFGGKQAPVNQDAIVQHVGFRGNLTLCNPLHTAKLVA